MNTYIILIYVLASAITYSSAFIFNKHLWFTIFLFPLPFFHACLHRSFSFLHGYLFGCISIGILLYDTLLTIINMATQKTGYARIIPSITLFFYLPIYAGIVLGVTQQCIKFFTISKNKALIFWTLALIIYFYCMDHYSFWLFDRKEGCFLLHPALTLAQFPFCLYEIYLFGKLGLSLIILLPAAIIIYSFQQNRKTLQGGSILFLIAHIAAIALYNPNVSERPLWLNHLVHMPIVMPSHYNHAKIIRKIQRICKQTIDCNPEAQCFLFPESSIYNATFYTDYDLQKLNNHHIGKKINLIFGAFRQLHNDLYNACIVIENGSLTCWHDKKHLMPLIERIPQWFKASCIEQNYFSQFPPISYGKSERPLINLTKQVQVVPYLCSELFCSECQDDAYFEKPILALCNDRWFSYFYTKNLMLAAAKIKATLWNRPIIYISYLEGLLITPQSSITYPIQKYRE